MAKCPLNSSELKVLSVLVCTEKVNETIKKNIIRVKSELKCRFWTSTQVVCWPPGVCPVKNVRLSYNVSAP